MRDIRDSKATLTSFMSHTSQEKETGRLISWLHEALPMTYASEFVKLVSEDYLTIQ